ncbi:MAG: Na+/H+ antiporter NhaA [Bacteroidales bacterium]|nr:Na+/H+ antiporter NhaA [Bacteroidales bacterium]MBN2698935.1 Na+/H+ antiporter NhaA [Bacteroidales bacterium]
MTLKPVEKFLKVEISGSNLLFIMTIVALLWANSPFSESYHSFWQHIITVGVGNIVLSKSILLWINDGLMAIFFFVIGLEIKREIIVGELSSVKKASLPLFAALGGMVGPVIIFLLINNNPETIRGWGIPMATDIAFALGILQLLGKRAPLSLKIFLTAFAIIDDIGGVLVIALFYSMEIKIQLIFYALAIWLVLLILGIFKFYSKYIFLIGGLVIWVLMLKSGLHPTLAGILLAFAIPVQKKKMVRELMNDIRGNMDILSRKEAINEKGFLTKEQLDAANELDDAATAIKSPLQHLETKLHGWVSLIIIPLFALANAGITLNKTMFSNINLSLAIALGLILGKVIGISLISLFSIKLKIAALPEKTTFKHLFGVSFLGGVGFTMSLFICNLAFIDPALIYSAKLGILAGSLVSGLLGFTIIRSMCKICPQ